VKPVLHRAVCTTPQAEWFERCFARNGWTDSWRNGVYDWDHYHLSSHEVLGCYAGQAMVRLGGDGGETVALTAGDVVIIPAGCAHRRLSSTADFAVVGAYPDGFRPDMHRGQGEPCPLPRWQRDPIFGDSIDGDRG
jgi:uncharacterized protein YjlB